MAGLTVAAVEDVVTTGDALVNGCLALRAVGAVVDTVVCATTGSKAVGRPWPNTASA